MSEQAGAGPTSRCQAQGFNHFEQNKRLLEVMPMQACALTPSKIFSSLQGECEEEHNLCCLVPPAAGFQPRRLFFFSSPVD